MFYAIHAGWNVDFDLPDLEDGINTDNSELTTITSSLPTTVTCTVTNSQTMTSVCPPTSSRVSKVCKACQADSYIFLAQSFEVCTQVKIFLYLDIIFLYTYM